MEIKQTKKNHSKLAAISYLYLLGYFLVSNAWFCYFASEKTPNKFAFYIVVTLSIFFAVCCFLKASKNKGKKGKKIVISDVVVNLVLAIIIVYIGIKIICISNGGSVRLF